MRACVKQSHANADLDGMATAAPSVVAEHAHAATLDPEVDEHIGAVRESEAGRLSGRHLHSAVFFASAFIATAAALPFVFSSPRSPGLVTVIGLIAAYAAASHARFEVGTGLFLPTELVFVPMLFLLPLGCVPLAICIGLLVGAATDLLRRGLPLERVLIVPLNSWHSIGPVAVLAIAGEAGPQLEHWPLYLAALGAQFATDYLVHAPHQRFVNGVSFSLAARFMSSAFLVDVALAPIGLLVALVAVDHPVALTFVLPLVGLLVVFARERQVRIDHALELSHAYRGTALLLGDVVEADDAYTGLHSRDVVSLVLDVCDSLGVNGRERRDAEFAALLHDVGKIKIPSEIINKPGKLTDEEFEVIKTHTVEGENLLAQVGGLLGNVGGIVRSCHEDWDGSGYPDRLAGAEIPRVARIVRCCDAYSAMTTDRPYRKAYPATEAIAELRRCAGTDFDPVVVEALVAAVETNG
jgi:HD-GYP domain-containing protein (c-di-GMP phosphodiesterase class II)